MIFINKLGKYFRWLRCSTFCAILFYMFFIGLILHSTSHKLQFHRQRQDSDSADKAPAQTWTARDEGPNSINQQHLPEDFSLQKQKPKRAHYSKQHLNLSKKHVAMALQHQQHPEAAVEDAEGDLIVVTGNKFAKKSLQTRTNLLTTGNEKGKQILANAFRRADRNHDGRLSIQELGQYINRRIVEHIDIAIMSNAMEFRRVDISPADGLITWSEYLRSFLHRHGMTEGDLDDHDEIKITNENRRVREEMMQDKARWSDAARTDFFTLTIDEYLSFKHPESSVSSLLELVDDLLRQFDEDGDDKLTLEEFSDLNVNDDDDLMRKSLISKTQVERREEFKHIIDKNHDGKADREELLNYVNPKTPRYALQEAATLFSLCDDNKDGLITLREMTDNAEIFLQSKMIDTANSFHTEF